MNKKLISFILILATIFVIASGCGNKEEPAVETTSTKAINPELIAAFGEEMIRSEEATIRKLVAGLEDCYKKYGETKDVNALLSDVHAAMESYTGYLEEISAELRNMYENEADKAKKMDLIGLYSTSIGYVAPGSTISNYIFFTENNMQPTCTTQELEEAIFKYMDSISEFFYCKTITNKL